MAGQPNVPITASPKRSESVFPLRFELVRRTLRRHERKLWWIHSVYALSLGTGVVIFARKGFAHARWLVVSLGLVWLIMLLFFRLFGSGTQRQDVARAEPGAKLRFTVLTYVLKNLYQGMLFFLLPFYWQSSTAGAINFCFVALLACCSVLSTLDLVFDRFLMRRRVLAAGFYGVALFGCVNLVIPAFLPNTRTLWTLLIASGLAVLAFWTVHVPFDALRRGFYRMLLVLSITAGVLVAYQARRVVPPVPMYLSSGAVGPMVLEDGRLAMEVRALHASVIRQLLAVTDIVTPGGTGDRLQHIWRHNGREVFRALEPLSPVSGPRGTIRLRSALTQRDLPARLAGHWSVDVETEDGQLVGRVPFTVLE